MNSAGVGSANVLSTGYSEANSDNSPAGITPVALQLASSWGQATAKSAKRTDPTISRVASGGVGSTSKSVGDTASISAPETSSSEPSYDPRDGDGEESEDYEGVGNPDGDIQEANSIRGDDDIAEDGGLPETEDCQ